MPTLRQELQVDGLSLKSTDLKAAGEKELEDRPQATIAGGVRAIRSDMGSHA